MKTLLLILASLAPLTAATFKSVPLVDNMCADKVKADPDSHTKSCALGCGEGGLGIVTTDGKYLKLDDEGNKKALAALKETSKEDHIRATITGDVKGDVLQVKSLKLD